MSRSHIRIKSLISVRMAAEMYKTRVCSSTGNTPSSFERASRENGSDGRLALGRWHVWLMNREATTREARFGHRQLARE